MYSPHFPSSSPSSPCPKGSAKSLLLQWARLAFHPPFRKPEGITARKVKTSFVSSQGCPLTTLITQPHLPAWGSCWHFALMSPKPAAGGRETAECNWVISFPLLPSYWDIQKLSKRRLMVFGAFKKAYMSLLMIHKSLKWCIWIKLPNRQQSLNYIIWKKVKKAAQPKLLNEILQLISMDKSYQSFWIQNTPRAVTVCCPLCASLSHRTITLPLTGIKYFLQHCRCRPGKASAHVSSEFVEVTAAFLDTLKKKTFESSFKNCCSLLCRATVPLSRTLHQEGALCCDLPRHHPQLQSDGSRKHSREPAAVPVPQHTQGQCLWQILLQA